MDSKRIVKFFDMRYPEIMDATENPQRAAVKTSEHNPRIKELATNYYNELLEAVLHLYPDRLTKENLFALAIKYAENQIGAEAERETAQQQAVLAPLLGEHGFFKQQYFWHLLNNEVDAAERRAEPERRATPNSALVMLDLDNFGDFNTRFGHPGGDKLLLEAGAAMAKNIRPGDFLGRVGGDELAAIIHGVNLDGAVAVARRLQAAVIKASQGEFASQGWTQTVSAGACLITPGCSGDAIRNLSDQALYASKEAGKNRISIGWIDSGTNAPRITVISPKEPALIR